MLLPCAVSPSKATLGWITWLEATIIVTIFIILINNQYIWTRNSRNQITEQLHEQHSYMEQHPPPVLPYLLPEEINHQSFSIDNNERPGIHKKLIVKQL